MARNAMVPMERYQNQIKAFLLALLMHGRPWTTDIDKPRLQVLCGHTEMKTRHKLNGRAANIIA